MITLLASLVLTASSAHASVEAMVVPGLSTNYWNRFGIPYLDENMAELRAMGIPATRIGIKTENSVATNAAEISEALRANLKRGTRTIIMAHSKGSTDVTAALALDPSLAEAVAGFIAIQPVYWGSPVADFVAENRALTVFQGFVFDAILGGQPEAVTGITHAARAEFIAAHPFPASRVPTVVISSTFRRALSRSVLWANEKFIRLGTGSGNDGMVTPADTVIPGACARLEYDDMDHFEPGVRVESPITPAQLTRDSVAALKRCLGGRL